MKLLSKLIILIGLVAFVSSCQKEKIPAPKGGCPSHQENTANQRVSGSDSAGTSDHAAINGEKDSGDDGEIVGGGDDDRDGGGSKKDKKN